MCILDLSKILMYEFYYDIATKIFDKIELCYMDTDSFILKIYDKNTLQKIC